MPIIFLLQSYRAPTRVEALSFMCSELQSLCVEAHRRRQSQRRSDDAGAAECDDSDERVRAMSAITALQRVLQVPNADCASHKLTDERTVQRSPKYEIQ